MCGLFGVIDYGKKIKQDQINDLLKALAIESSVRGMDATGIAFVHSGNLAIVKEARRASQMHFFIPRGANAIIGHTRHATQGNAIKRRNNHPFRGHLTNGREFALAHNGVIINDKALRERSNLPNTKIETDSFIAVQLLEKENELTFEKMADMVEKLSGSYTFSILDDKNNTYLIKGDNPLSIIELTQLGVFIYASTDQILWRAISSTPLLSELKSGRSEEIPIKEGEILKISSYGTIARGKFHYRSDYYLSGRYNWWDYNLFKDSLNEDDDIDELKEVAYIFGYSAEDVEYLKQSGYSYEEIEETLYCKANK